jgi:pimeloyl-ACP methyl ester carboxylesterase
MRFGSSPAADGFHRKMKNVKSRRRKTIFIKFLVVVLTAYALCLLVLYFSQRSLMYHPDKGDEKKFLAAAAKLGILPWRNARGQLIGWKRISQKPTKNRMLVLHGNGGNALSRTYLLDGFETTGNWDFYLLEYSGYAWRGENPNQNGIFDSAQAALQQLMDEEKTPVFIAGESLGTGVACLLAGKMPRAVRGLFLITPYTATVDVAAGRYPIFPVRFLMKDQYQAAAALREYSGPVAILLAGNDIIVPARFGQALFDGYNGPKKLWIQPDAGHSSLNFDPKAKMWREIVEFWQQ